MSVFLVTNDDGILAPGLLQLARALVDLGRVVVVAPDRERSSTGHAITLHKPLRAQEVFLTEGVEAYHVNGTPSDCVKLGVDVLAKEKPSVVFSGINNGANLGTDILYSGTVSGAMEGVILGIPAAAFSLARGERNDYRAAALFARRLARLLAEHQLPPGVLLNVNVPDVPPEDIRGVRVTRLGARRYRDVLHERKDPRGRSYYWLAGEAVDMDEAPDTDAAVVRAGYISVTPVHFDLTHYPLIGELHQWPWCWEEVLTSDRP